MMTTISRYTPTSTTNQQRTGILAFKGIPLDELSTTAMAQLMGAQKLFRKSIANHSNMTEDKINEIIRLATVDPDRKIDFIEGNVHFSERTENPKIWSRLRKVPIADVGKTVDPEAPYESLFTPDPIKTVKEPSGYNRIINQQ
jgi:hypothetical protein